jgi:uncharacterized protein
MRFSIVIVCLLCSFHILGQQSLIDGAFKETYSNGQLKITGFYNGGKADSTWTFYFPDGKIYKTGKYRDCYYDLSYIKILRQVIDYEWHERGVEDGIWKIYHQNGILKSEYKSVCGTKTGIVRVFNDKKDLETESFYSNGEIQCEKEFFEKGIVSKYSTFTYYNLKENEKHNSRHFIATVSIFYITGELQELYHEEKNELQGEYKKFWQNGFLQYEATFENGVEEGIVKEYYDNGLRESETVYKNGEKHGKSFLYSKDGKVINTETWDNGILKKS